MELAYRTRGQSAPQGKQRVYFTCHPQDFHEYFPGIAEELLAYQSCAIYYDTAPEATLTEEEMVLALGQMQLFVVPITARFLHSENRAREVELRFAREHHIPILPLMQEAGLEAAFNTLLGGLQFLNKADMDDTAIPYEKKLQDFLSATLVGDELITKIRAAFDAYIFLSYRKRDRAHANALMRMIHEQAFCRDIAIWYDEFLTPGERFHENIREALKGCRLFVLVVTPNLINESNYVMHTEYPMALAEGKVILPAEMVETDHAGLRARYRDLPDTIARGDRAGLAAALAAGLSAVGAPRDREDPAHLFLIGLAYLDGVDVEVNLETGLRLITQAAEAGYLPAMKQLRNLYTVGKAVKTDYYEAILWQARVVLAIREQIEENPEALPLYLEEASCLGADQRRAGILDAAYDTYEAAAQVGDHHIAALLTGEGGMELLFGIMTAAADIARLLQRTDTALMWYDRAERMLGERLRGQGEDAGEDIRVAYLMMKLLRGKAGVYQGIAELDHAAACAKEALSLCEAVEKNQPPAEHAVTVAYVYIANAEIAFDRGDYSAAEGHYLKAIHVLDGLYAALGADAVQRMLGRLYHRLETVAHFRADMEQKYRYAEKAAAYEREAHAYEEDARETTERRAKEAYERGDHAAAYALYRELADAGVVEALSRMAFLHRMGRGTARDIGAAVALYERAVDAGDGTAAATLGMMYRDGDGVEQDETHALALFRRAMELGDAGGRLLYQALEEKLAYIAARENAKQYTRSPEAYSRTDACKTILEVTVGETIISFVLDTAENAAYLVRPDGLFIDRFSVWAFGWGDTTSYEIHAEGDTLCLTEASFSHYDRFTEITTYRYCHITEDEIEVTEAAEEDIRGRHLLPIEATRLLKG